MNRFGASLLRRVPARPISKRIAPRGLLVPALTHLSSRGPVGKHDPVQHLSSFGCRKASSITASPPSASSSSLASKTYSTAVGGRTRIVDILDSSDGGVSLLTKHITVCGWIRTLRAQKGFSFLKVNDGTTHAELQVVVTPEAAGFEELGKQGTGASVRVVGKVVESKGKGQTVEILCDGPDHSIKVLGGVDPATYPLAKKFHSPEFLRSVAHLRPRTNLIGAVSRVRNELAASTHRFFQDRGFLYVTTPIITTADCEGAGDMFRVSVGDEAAALPTMAGAPPSGSQEFFGQPAYLTVSGQLSVENFCCALGDVYSFGPTFRAERSNTTRHLSEFWMLEPELAFADLHDNMNCAEDYVRHCAQDVLERCSNDLQFFQKRVDKDVIGRLEKIANTPFVRVSYTEAIEVLREAVKRGEAKFEYEPIWGKELQTEHEKYLTDRVYAGPAIVHDYPIECKAFYMRLNDDHKTVAAMDVLVPQLGELVGGSQREERLDVLDKRLEDAGMNKDDYWWYRDLRRYGSVPHSGFGVGFERLVMLCTGVQNIRDVIPFPRYVGHASF